MFLNHQLPSHFQKHEDESESWLHRQVGHETRQAGFNGRRLNKLKKIELFYFSGSAERSTSLLPRWTQVFLHQSDPSGREREVFPHFNVYVHGEQPGQESHCGSDLKASAQVCLFSPAAEHQHRHPAVADLRGLGRHQDLGLQSQQEPHVRLFPARFLKPAGCSRL